MTVVAHDPALRRHPSPPGGVRLTDTLDELLRVSDVLSLHVPLTRGTRGLIGAAQLAALPAACAC